MVLQATRFTRASQLAAALCASGVLISAAPVFAQAFPAKPIRIIVNVSPGSSADLVARTLSVPLQQALGQPVVVENRAGAAGMIGPRGSDPRTGRWLHAAADTRKSDCHPADDPEARIRPAQGACTGGRHDPIQAAPGRAR
jgi:hypothetical protein